MLFLAYPSLSILSVMLGILLIYWEANRPGMVIPGCTGLALVLFGGYQLGRLTLYTEFVGIVLIGYALTIAEAFFPLKWLLTLVGIAAMSLGLHHLVLVQIVPVTWTFSILASIILGFLTTYLSTVALKARRAKRSMRLERDTLNAVSRP